MFHNKTCLFYIGGGGLGPGRTKGDFFSTDLNAGAAERNTDALLIY